jgi:Leu/Phe-tRNA-protein transferase
MYLRYTETGYLAMLPEDDPHLIVDAMLCTGYSEEFCVSPDFSPGFITRLMEAGFLVMSSALDDEEEGSPDAGASAAVSGYILLPKLHLVRSALFFENLHVKKSIRRYVSRYELRPDSDFEYIIERCVKIHGDGWLTPPLIDAITKIRRAAGPALGPKAASGTARPASFALYRDGKLVAGEFGVQVGRVYTSYSGYYDEANAGTVQLILAARWLQDHGFAFFDLGMPLDYKTDLGAVDISQEEFVSRFRAATDYYTNSRPR